MTPITTIADLQQIPNWIVFDQEPQPDGKKPRKIPYTPGTTTKALPNDPRTWRTYAEASADAERTGRHPAVALTPAMSLTLIDVDGRIDHDLIATVDSYAEASINGGLHLLVRGRPPAGFVAPAGIEVYPRDGNRFLLLTEDVIAGRDTIEDRTEMLAQLFPPAARLNTPLPELDLDDTIIVERVRGMQKGRRLFDAGDTSLYGGDHSRADLGLLNCFVSAGATDPDQLDRLFRSSALYRDDKWERASYREPTIAEALDGTVVPFEGYTQGPQATSVRAFPTDSQTLGFAPSPCAERVAELERTLAERDATIAALQLQVEALSRIPRILANRSHGPSRVVAAVVATQIAWRASAGETPPKEREWDVPLGMMAINLSGPGGIADRAGVSVNTASSHLQTLEDRGLLRKETKSVKIASEGEVNPDSGVIYDEDQYVTQLFIGPARITPINAQAAIDLSNDLANFSIERTENRGGKRTPRCPDHPDAKVIREFVDRCSVPSCQRQLNEGEYPLPPMLLGPPQGAPAPPATESQTLGGTKTAVVDHLYRPQSLGFGQDPCPAPTQQRTLVAGSPAPTTGLRRPPGHCLDCGEKIPIGTFYCERHGGAAPPDHWTDGAYGVRA